jgi:hypothetical protein
MAMRALFEAAWHGFLGVIISANVLYAEQVLPYTAPPGTYHTSWIGNSFGGSGAVGDEGVAFHSNGFGHWVQDSVGSMAVSTDGTVLVDARWDEGGHGVGLYKNGQTNRVPVIGPTPWKSNGMNASGTAICVDDSFFYVVNVHKALLRFRWTPGDINSSKFIDEVLLPERATGLSCSNGKILVGYSDKIELRDETSMQLTATYPAIDVSAVLLARDGSFWLIVGGKIRHLQSNGNDTGVEIPGIGSPASLAWAENGSLIVTDNGPSQQVLFFDVSGLPKLASTFGAKGGLYSGTPGAVAPQKLFGLRGAGMDSKGNLYIGMSFTSGPSGDAFIRAFSPSGDLLWEDYNASFVDTFGFQPGSDGTVVYGRTTRWQLNLHRKKPGSEATLTALTLNPLTDPQDSRINGGFSVYPRLIKGTQLIYALGQYDSGFTIFAESPGTEIFHQVAKVPKKGWAWYVTDEGNIWNGDAPNQKIALYRLQSITDGKPDYDWQNPQTWPWPADFKTVTRVIYNKNSDSLYVFGFLDNQSAKGIWGTLGLTARRYDGWFSNNPHLVWTNNSLPVSIISPGKTLFAKDVSLAGDYLFLGMIRDAHPDVHPMVNILNAGTGQFVGTLEAGPEVGSIGGWADVLGSVQAIKRHNGEYLVLIEDDFRGKNILFRWTP